MDKLASPSSKITMNKEKNIMQNRIKQRANCKLPPSVQSARLAKAAKAVRNTTDKPWLNYRDPTAYAALRNVEKAKGETD